jgi:transcription initiation factor TFIIB
MNSKTQIKKRRKLKRTEWTLFKDYEKKMKTIYEESMTINEECSVCKSELKDSCDGFMTCSSNMCGIIYKNTLDRSAEWRFHNGTGFTADPSRCGMPINPLLKESSFGSRTISNGSLSPEKVKIRNYIDWSSMPYKEKSQYDDFEIIKTSRNHGISKCIIDDALQLHQKISQYCKTYRGLNRAGIIAASVYISSRMNNYPRTPKDIAIIFNLDKTSATDGCKNASLYLEQIEKDLDGNMKTKLFQTKPVSFIDRYCSNLHINNELTSYCKFLAVFIEKNNLIPENTPHSVAAGLIYFVAYYCNLNISKEDVRNISEISEVTINKCCNKLIAISRHTPLLPKEISDKYSIRK